MEDRPIDISIITVNYNGWKDTREFLDSYIQHIHSVSYELIVVDNASQTDEALSLQQLYPQIKVIRNDKNLGFAGANNKGMEIAQGKYWFFLNNDTLIEEDNFPNLIKRLESDPQIAGVSPLIRNCNQHRTIQYAGYTPLSPITLRNRAIGEGTKDASPFPAKETPFLHGAAMLFKREAIQQVGKMPEIFFLYYEELDWCTAMNRQGYTLWFEPSCEILHKGSSTIGNTSPLKAFYLSRNRLLYAYRNRTGLTRILCILYLLCIATPVQCMRAILHRQKGICQAHLRGIYDFIKLKPKMS